jgi:hypothetical protein
MAAGASQAPNETCASKPMIAYDVELRIAPSFQSRSSHAAWGIGRCGVRRQCVKCAPGCGVPSINVTPRAARAGRRRRARRPAVVEQRDPKRSARSAVLGQRKIKLRSSHGSRRAPSQVFGLPEGSRRTPNQVFGLREGSRRTPNQVFGLPEGSRRTPSQVFGLPEGSRRTPKQVFGLSGHSRRTEEQVHGRSAVLREPSANYFRILRKRFRD